MQSLEDDREELESEVRECDQRKPSKLSITFLSLVFQRDYFAGKCVSLENDREESNRARPPPQDLLQHTIDENRFVTDDQFCGSGVWSLDLVYCRKQKLELIEVQAERDRALNKIERYKVTAFSH